MLFDVEPNPPVVWVCPKADGALVAAPNGEALVDPKPVDVAGCPKAEPPPPNAEVPKAPA